MITDYKKIILIVLSLVLLLSLGNCTKRSNPVKPTPAQGKIWIISPEANSWESLQGNLIGDGSNKGVLIYTPPAYEDVAQARRKYPLLYLLHGFEGNQTTFNDIYNIKEVADRLVNSGEIQPMIIVMPDGSNQLGGSFYTNSVVEPVTLPYTGYYEDFIVKELMSYIDQNFRVKYNKEGQDILKDTTYKWNRAISGHSMGGYGALKIALDHDSLFGAASAMSAPLTFNGDGDSFLGILVWIPGIFAENNVIPGDSAAYAAMNPFAGHLSAKMFAMAAAFSPHSDFAGIDTSYRFLKNLGAGWGVDIPIDWNGEVVDWIWKKWLENDIQTKVDTMVKLGKVPFEDVEIYFDCADHDGLLLQYHAQIFHQTLQALGIPHTYQEYQGYDNYPAGHHNFIYDRLAEVLKFHSGSFPEPVEEE
jgi:S-formylglutathione hydrolase FrmB